MKKLIAGTIIIVLICITAAGATPVGTVPSGSAYQPGIMADTHDVVVTHETIQEQRQDIRQDVRLTNQDIHENLTSGHSAVQDQRQAVQQNVQENREAVKSNESTIKEAVQNVHENLSAGNEAIEQVRQGVIAYVHQSRIELVDNVTDLNSQIQAERKADQEQIANFTDAQKLHLMNWYDTQIAAHSLMAMENLSGDIGPRVAEIADDINSSESNITPLEQRIDDRSGFFRFMFGGDRSAANQINQQVALNQQRIQMLELLAQNSSVQPDVQQAMQDQISVLQQEQARLANLTAAESNSTGLLSWI